MKKYPIYIFSVLFILVWQSTASAYDPERAVNNYAHDLATCSAFYMLISEAPNLDEATSKKYLDAGVSLGQLSVKLTSKKLALARFELELKSMKREMENDWGNASIILNKYGYFCKDLAEKPEARMQYWLDKKE